MALRLRQTLAKHASETSKFQNGIKQTFDRATNRFSACAKNSKSNFPENCTNTMLVINPQRKYLTCCMFAFSKV